MIDQQNLAVNAFESSAATSSSRRLVRLHLRGIWTNFNTTITAFESAYEFLSQPTVSRDVNMMTNTPKLQFADPTEQDDLPIEILVGGDHYWKVVTDITPLHISPSLVLLPSKLGWILSGNRSGVSANVAAANSLHLDGPAPVSETEIKKFWDIENIGITAHQGKSCDSKDSVVLQAFHDSFRIQDNRRVVFLPKKGGRSSSKQRTECEEQVQITGKKVKQEREPASRLLYPHAGLRTWTSGGRRSRQGRGGHILLASPRGVQR